MHSDTDRRTEGRQADRQAGRQAGRQTGPKFHSNSVEVRCDKPTGFRKVRAFLCLIEPESS